jgi:recombinase/recombinase-like zinc beta ribbon protein
VRCDTTIGALQGNGAPVGYRRTKSGRLRLDPNTAGVMAEVFRRRASGESGASLGRWLEAQGVRTGRGNPGWTSSTLCRVLRNRVYLGEVQFGSNVNEHAHPALVDAATWEAAKRPRRAVVKDNRDAPLLARLARCAGCSMAMSLFWKRGQGLLAQVCYRCNAHSAAGRCPAPASIDVGYLEAYVEERVFDLLRRRRRAPARAIAQQDAALAAACDALERYRDSDQVLRTLGTDAYVAGLTARSERVRRTRLHLAALRDAHDIHTLPPVAELERRWPDMSDAERRDVIARVIDGVFVSAGRRPIEDRVTVCRAGTAPRLPQFGPTRGGQARPFTPQAAHRLPLLKPWPTRRIESELGDYLLGQRVWPPPGAFAAAGRRRLHEQVVRHAGIAGWAHHFGLPVPFPVRNREPWTDRRIRAALELYLRRKGRFPTAVQFQADGLGSLHLAIMRAGGTRRWSKEVAMPIAPNQRRHRPAYPKHG